MSGKATSAKVPCPCDRCKGALVTRQTERIHRKQDVRDLPSFSAWQGTSNQQPTAATTEEPSKKRARVDSNAPEAGSNDVNSDMEDVQFTRTASFSGVPTSRTSFGSTELDRAPSLDLSGSASSSSAGKALQPLDDPEPSDSDVDQSDSELDALLARQMAEDVERARAAHAVLEAERAQDNEQHGGHNAEDEDDTLSNIKNIQITQHFIREIRSATLDNGKLNEATLHRIRNPPETPVDISDPDVRYSLDLFLAVTNATDETYNKVRLAALRRHPEDNILSLYEVKKLVQDLTGVVTVADDMCINSCLAFVGPFEDMENCPECGESRFDPGYLKTRRKKVPRQEHLTILLGPILQAIRRSKTGAKELQYLQTKMDAIAALTASLEPDLAGADMVYDDVLAGSEFWDLVERCEVRGAPITGNDTLIGVSVDGLQLYKNKKSDTWLWIWVLYSIGPETRYKRKYIFPGGVVKGPNKPKNLDSFLFRSLHHLSAIQREHNGAGLKVWDGARNQTYFSRTLFAFATADAVGLPDLDGRVGHHGARACRLGCPMKGRHKAGVGHYYAPHLRPHNFDVPGCDHADIDIRDLSILTPEQYKADLAAVCQAPTETAYKAERKRTGISKPSILSGLLEEQTFPIPSCFCPDAMHLAELNLQDLLISLWRGTMDCEPTDSKDLWDWMVLKGQMWKDHGQEIADAAKYFPSSFHRPPRNPAEKISSGYKATEFYLYVFALGPAHFRKLLPEKYWKNFCKLARAIRLALKRYLTGSNIQEAYTLMIQFVEEFEMLYYQRRLDRIHFCRPCIHTLLHMIPEILRVGPGAYTSQFTLERTIGDLGRQVHQPSDPFANLTQRTVRYAMINALTILCGDELDPPKPNPRGSYILSHDYLLLRAKDRHPRILTGCIADALVSVIGTAKVRRWARLRLPNGQILRSLWKEQQRKTTSAAKIGRNAKLLLNGKLEFGEVQFFFLHKTVENGMQCFAAVSIYSQHDRQLWNDSSKTIWACNYSGDADIRIVLHNTICEVVSMQPLPPLPGEPENRWFVVEKSGLGGGLTEPADFDNEDEAE